MSTSDVLWKAGGVIWTVGKWIAIATIAVPTAILILVLVVSLFLDEPPAKVPRNQPAQRFENNYRPGTEAYAITKVASDTFPNLDIVLSDLKYQGQMTDEGRAGHPDSALKMLQTLGRRTFATFKDRPINPLGSMEWSPELLKLNACVIYLPENPLTRGVVAVAGTVLHEAIHCSDASARLNNKERLERLSIHMFSNKPELLGAVADVSRSPILRTVIIEAFVTAMLRSLSFAPEATGELASITYRRELKSAKDGVLANESPSIALVMEKLCSKPGDCPTTALGLMEFLYTNDTYIEALSKDFLRWEDLKKNKRM